MCQSGRDRDCFGLLFVNPGGRGNQGNGSAIFNNRGNPIWYEPSNTPKIDNLMRITYDGQPMLAFFHGGRGGGEFVLMNEHYQVVSYLRAGNGLEANVHELTITPENTALIGAFLRVKVNLTAFGGKAGQVVDDYVVQEIDVATGNVLFSWNSLGHVPVTNVYRFGKAPFDGSPHSLGITPHRCRHAEEEVAGLVAQALSNRQIADRLVLSERTVETHVRSILAKLSFSTRTEIATWVLRTSAASPGPAPERG